MTENGRTPEQDAEIDDLVQNKAFNYGMARVKVLGTQALEQQVDIEDYAVELNGQMAIFPRVRAVVQSKPSSNKAIARVDVARESAARKPFPEGNLDDPLVFPRDYLDQSALRHPVLPEPEMSEADKSRRAQTLFDIEFGGLDKIK